MIYIFDLDYTLFKTKEFFELLAEAFGLSTEEFFLHMKTYFREPRLNYHPDRHFAVLLEKHVIAEGQVGVIREKLDEAFRRTNEYVWEGAGDYLECLTRKGEKLHLVSYGNIEYQNLKIEHLDINKYFEKIIVTDKNKVESIEFLKGAGEKFVIVNDNAKECLEMSEALGGAEIIMTEGPYNNNVAHNIKPINHIKLFSKCKL